jgi:hypothetical protein
MVVLPIERAPRTFLSLICSHASLSISCIEFSDFFPRKNYPRNAGQDK